MMCLLMFLLVGCGANSPVLHRLAPLPEGATCRVAVLPIINQADYPQGGEMFYKIFSAELVSFGHFQVAQEGDVRNLYQQLMVYPNQPLTLEQLKVISNRLNVRLVIGGTVLVMREHKGAESVNPDITILMRIYDGVTGKTLWTTYHRRKGSDYQRILRFGQINTLTGLAHRMSREILTLWFKKGMKRCATLPVH